MILETERLRLCEMEQSDLRALCLMLQDREVMYAYAHAFSAEESQAWLDRQRQRYLQDGFGLWAVVQKGTEEMIGQCGLTWQDWGTRQVLEVGYLFQKAHWHSGYAIEAATACKEYAFRVLRATEVCSIIRENNLPSQIVAKRNGMTVQGRLTKHYYGIDMPHLVFAVGTPDRTHTAESTDNGVPSSLCRLCAEQTVQPFEESVG